MEVKTIPLSPSKCHSIDDIAVNSDYDVPKRRFSLSRMIRKSQSSFNLNQRTKEDERAFQRSNRQPPMPSPRKVYECQGASDAPPLPERTPTDAAKRLIFEDHDNSSIRSKVSPQFSSKTLKPKKMTSHNDTGIFRPRNNSESNKQPEEVYNELAAILERRRQNLESGTCDQEPGPRPKKTAGVADQADSIPQYSTVNKATKLQKIAETGTIHESRSQRFNETKPIPSFLHTFVNSAQFISPNKNIDTIKSVPRRL